MSPEKDHEHSKENCPEHDAEFCQMEQDSKGTAHEKNEPGCSGNHHDHSHSHAHSHASHDHGHSHSHLSGEPTRSELTRLKQVFCLTVLYLIAELVGGWMSGSLALLADGFHMFADAAGLGIALLAQSFLHKPAPKFRTFGYQRLEVLAALINALSLFAMAFFILWESVQRFSSPLPISSGIMLPIAIGGFIINLISLKLLHGGHHHNLNVKGAYLHVLSDLMGSVGAIVAGSLVMAFGWTLADPILSCLIAVLILWSAYGLLRDAINILLEGCPTHINIHDVRSAILGYTGILEVHNLHVWAINSQHVLLTAHLVVTQNAFSGESLNKVQHELKQTFGLSHVTLQMETAEAN